MFQVSPGVSFGTCSSVHYCTAPVYSCRRAVNRFEIGTALEPGTSIAKKVQQLHRLLCCQSPGGVSARWYCVYAQVGWFWELVEARYRSA